MSAGLIDMLVQDRVNLLIEYPNVMQHYLAQHSQSTELTSFSIEEAEPYMLGYILCAKTPEGQQLTQFFSTTPEAGLATKKLSGCAFRLGRCCRQSSIDSAL